MVSECAFMFQLHADNKTRVSECACVSHVLGDMDADDGVRVREG